MNKKSLTFYTPYSIALNKGFTLIELMVAMIILAALVFIATSSFMAAQLKARDAQRKSDLKQIANALESFYTDYGVYPDSDSQNRILGCGTAGNETACLPGNAFALSGSSGQTIYMVQLPDDPKDGEYLYMSNGSSYQLYARLENHRDKEAKNPTDEDPNNDNGKDIYVESGCFGSLGCNYGTSSTNIPLEPALDATDSR